MKKLLIPVLAAWPLASALAAEEVVLAQEAETLVVIEADGTPAHPFEGKDVTLEEFRWIARPVVVFADSPADPAFRRQIELLAQRPEALAERDVVVIVDADPAARSPVRLALRPRGFALVLIDKDGEVELRKPAPWDVREITRSIDKMPLRQDEIRERGLTGG